MIIEVTRLAGRILKGYPLTGIDRVCIEYLNHFKGYTKTSIYFFNKLWILNENFSERLINALQMKDTKRILSVFAKAAFNTTSNNDGEIFINLSHSGGLDSEEYGERINGRNLKKIFMVHDLIPIEHPEFAREGEKKKHEIRMKNIIETADLIFTNSEYTRKKLIEYAMMRFGKNIEDRVEVNYLGISSKLIESVESNDREILLKYGIKDKYFVVLSTIEPRKNHLILFYAWKELFEMLADRTPQLVIIGRRGWEIEQVLDFIERSSISPFIREINECSDLHLKTILRNSQALLMPSIDEGFGLPVLEALMLDVLTVCSKIPVFAELFEDIPIYCSWCNASEWSNVILDILSGKREEYLRMQRQKLLKYSDKLRQYSWDLHFARLKDILIKHDIHEIQFFSQKGEFNLALKW